jgi:hypothetical protein
MEKHRQDAIGPNCRQRGGRRWTSPSQPQDILANPDCYKFFNLLTRAAFDTFFLDLLHLLR